MRRTCDEMIRVFRTDQKMEVHEARPRRHVEPHLDIREDELNVGKAPGSRVAEAPLRTCR